MALADTELDDVGYQDDEEELKRKGAIPLPPPVTRQPIEQSMSVAPATLQEPYPQAPPISQAPQTPAMVGSEPPPVRSPSTGPAAQAYENLRAKGPAWGREGKVGKVLDVLGMVTGPGRLIEQTAGLGSLGYSTRLGQARTAAQEEQTQAKAPLDIEKEKAITEEAQARAEKARNDAKNPPKRQYENIAQLHADAVQDAISRGVDPAKDPKVLQIEDSIQRIQKETPQKPDTQTQEDQRYEQIKKNAVMKKPISLEDAAWAQAYEKRKTLMPYAGAAAQAPQKNTERSDKSYTLHSARLDKLAVPVDQIMQRFGRLKDTLDQNSPQADALVAPELLSVMSGGQGSGLRMNEAEIARIVGGRSVWENLKAAINHWQTDPNAARSITPDQDKQIRSLVETVHGKLIQKQQIIEEAQSELVASDDPIEHRKIVVEAQKKLDAIDAGGTSQGRTGTTPSAAPNSPAATPPAKGKIQFTPLPH